MYGILTHTHKKNLIRLTHTPLQPTSDTNKKEIITKK